MGLKRCDWCGERLTEYYAGRPHRFCTDKDCATKYHNEMKRMKRQYDIMIKEALRLNENLARGGEMGMQAMKMIQNLMPCLVSSHAVDISCSKCGQKRILMPESWDKCSFCGENAWTVKPREQLT